MGRRPARFTEADLARVFAAAKRVGMAVRVDLVSGVVDLIPLEKAMPPIENAREQPAKPKRIMVL